jgi:thiamine biosynthesis lipoprotein ApbE
LVNFGGDVAVRNVRRDGQPWQVGIEHAGRIGMSTRLVHLSHGGLATSGDSRRFVFRDGTDTRTSWMPAQAGRCAMRRDPSLSPPTLAPRPALSRRLRCCKAKAQPRS